MSDPIISWGDVPAGTRWVDVRPRRADYEAGHLAGAVHADLESDLSGDTSAPANGGRHPLPAPAEFAARLGSWGIGPGDFVVAYDANGGALAAARFWWMLRALGHRRVAILDGGLPVDAELTTEIPSFPPVTYPAPNEWALPTVDIATVRQRKGRPDNLLLDVRAAERFDGKVEPIDPVAGSIPGAVNLPLANNLDDAGKFKSPGVLREQYAQLLGNVQPAHLMVSCGSGVTACHTLAALERAGLGGASLYVGSWSEWCRQAASDEASGSE